MVAVTNLRLPASWTTAQANNPAFDISADALDDDLEVIGDTDWGAFDIIATGFAGTNFQANDTTAAFSIADATGIVTLSGSTFNVAGATITNTGVLTLPTSTDTLIGRATTDTLTNKTLTSPVLTTPQINDTSADHQYIFAVSELIADRTVTLPLLTGNDTFTFNAFAATLTNKTIDADNNTISNIALGAEATGASTDLTDTADIAYLNTANTFIAGNKQTLSQSATTAGFNLGAVAGAPSSPAEGDVWYNGTGDKIEFRDAAATREVVTLDNTQTLTNKTLTSPTLTSAVLTTPQINDTSADHQYIFAVSELIADRTVTLPLLTGNDTFVFNDHAQTLTNKTLTAPIISTISNTGTLTLPTSTDTLVGRATTDTLTNKTLGTATTFSVIPTINDGITFTFNPSGTVSGLNVGAHTADPSAPVNGDMYYDSVTNKFRAYENSAWVDAVGGGGSSLPVADTQTIVKGSADATKLLRFEVDGFTTATTRVLTPPNADATIVGADTTQTLTNKTIDADLNTISDITDNEVKAAAGIAVNKLAALSASRAMETDVSGFASASSVTSTELSLLSGLTTLQNVPRQAYTYLIEKDGSNYVAWKHDGSQVSSNTDLETVFDAVLTDKTTTGKAVIQFTEGTFTWTTKPIFQDHDDLTIQGAANGTTVWEFDSSLSDANPLMRFEKSGSMSYFNLAAISYGDRSVSFAADLGEEANFSIGDWINIISDDTIDSVNANRQNGIFGRVSETGATGNGILQLYGSIDEAGLTTTPRVAVLDFVENLTIRDLTILDSRNGLTVDPGESIIRVSHHNNPNLHGVRFTDCRWGSIRFNRCNFTKISNSHIDRPLQFDHDITVGESSVTVDESDEFNYGFTISSCENTTITNVTGHYARHFVTSTQGASDDTQGKTRGLAISNFAFADSTSTHIDCGHEGVERVTISNGSIRNHAFGITNWQGINSRSECKIDNVDIEGTWQGIHIANENGSGSSKEHPSTISNCRLNVQDVGIRIDHEVQRAKILGCDIIGTGANFVGIDFERTDASTQSGDFSIVRDCYIDGTTTTAGSVGIRGDGSIGVSVKGTTIRRVEQAVECNDTDARAADWVVDSNFFLDNTNNNASLTGSNHKNGPNIEGEGDTNQLFRRPISFQEQAAASADVAGQGQIWVKTATPNELWFTDDAGTDHFAAGGKIRTIIKAADETVNNTTTLQDDDDFTFTVKANTTYFFDCWFFSVSATTTPDIDIAFTNPSSPTYAVWNSGASAGGVAQAFATEELFACSGGSGRNNVLSGLFINGANAGSVTMQWAQNTATAENTTIKAGGIMRVYEL